MARKPRRFLRSKAMSLSLRETKPSVLTPYLKNL